MLGFLIWPELRFVPQSAERICQVPRFLYFCFADNLDFLTLWRCHLSALGLLRNNCQFITQVGVAERARIVFIRGQIQIQISKEILKHIKRNTKTNIKTNTQNT